MTTSWSACHFLLNMAKKYFSIPLYPPTTIYLAVLYCWTLSHFQFFTVINSVRGSELNLCSHSQSVCKILEMCFTVVLESSLMIFGCWFFFWCFFFSQFDRWNMVSHFWFEFLCSARRLNTFSLSLLKCKGIISFCCRRSESIS